MAIWKHLRAILLLPVTAIIIVPAGLIYFTGDVTFGWGLPFPYTLLSLLAGCAFLGVGLLLLFKTIAQFASIGRGTLAPWDPTQRLVVEGVYRYVRNPMISGVLFVLLGEAALLGSLALLFWSLLFFLLNAIYIPLAEERGLAARFGRDYELYRQNVPRWIPRLRPWTPESDEQSGPFSDQ